MARKFRVAYMLHRFPDLTETFIMRELYWLQERGVDVNIFSLLSPKGAMIHDQAKQLLPRTHYSSSLSWEVIKAQLYFIGRSPRRYLRALAKTVWQTYREPGVLARALALFPKSVYFSRQVEKLKIDHIHAHFVWLGGIAAGIASDLLDVPFTIHPHAFGLFGRNQRDVRCELENATQIVTISNYHRSYIRQLCPRMDPDDIHVVYCALETDGLRPDARPRRDGPIRILSVGRLIEKKGFEYLIDACALLAERGIGFRCRIVGAGPRQSELQAAIDRHGLQDQVTLLGALSQERICELYQESDIFALPCVVARDGDRDGLPVVLMEALAFEVCAVTTPVTGVPELVEDEVTGLLVEERDALGLADALERLIGDESLRKRLGKQGRELVLQRFAIQRNVARLASIFRRVGRGRRMTPPSTVTTQQCHT